jgi:hypothetical protein
MKRLFLFSMACLVLAGLVGCSGSKTTTIPTSTVSPELQTERLDFINQMISQGYFQKVEKPADYPHTWVTSLFMALDFKDKESFVSVVYAYYISDDPNADMVVLYDSKTGKQVGVYAAVYGGLKMD